MPYSGVSREGKRAGPKELEGIAPMTTYALKVDGDLVETTDNTLDTVFFAADVYAMMHPESVVVVEEIEDGNKAVFWTNKPA
jgi:hypothetical protein